MARNELCVKIPSYFKCPISMEVMKSPVSLSTGVTYDRSSIQRWLESGNTTCPATMQPLSSPSFVPNLTLLRLMNLWPSLSLPSPRNHLVNNGVDEQQNSLVSFRKLLSQAKSSDECCRVLFKSQEFSDSLRKVYLEAKESEEYCRVLANSEDLLDSVLRLIILFDEKNKNDHKVESLELMLLFLDLVVSENDVRTYKMLINCCPKFVFVMQNGTFNSKVAIARILRKIVKNEAETKGVITEGTKLIHEAYNLVKYDDDSAIEAGLELIIAVAENSRHLKKELVRLALVKRVGEILCDVHRSGNKVVTLRLMEALEMMATCIEGRKAICEEEKCVEEVVKRLMKVSEKVTEHGVTVLWSVCYKMRDEKVVEVVRKCNGVGKCLLLLQSNCKAVVKQMCADLFKVLRGSGKSGLASYVTKTTHVMAH